MGSGADSRLPRDSSHIQSTCIYYTSPTRVFLFLCCRAVGRNQPTSKRPLLLFVLLGRLELPVLAADRAPLLGLGREPLRDALQVKSVTTGTPHHGAVIAGILGFRGTPIKGVPADAAHVVPRVPGPRSECPPVLDLDLESPRPLAARDRPASTVIFTPDAIVPPLVGFEVPVEGPATSETNACLWFSGPAEPVRLGPSVLRCRACSAPRLWRSPRLPALTASPISNPLAAISSRLRK